MPEADFHRIADRSLDEIHDLMSVLEADDISLDEDVEISMSQGVLKLDLGKKVGIWVINKQTPNRQLWWSSPISGPKRYEYAHHVVDERCDEIFNKQVSTCSIEYASKWFNTKDKSPLMTLLRDEIIKSVDIDIAKH
jgi:frataxin